MAEVIVEAQAANAAAKSPTFPLDSGHESSSTDAETSEWMRNSLGEETTVFVRVKGKMGPKEIGKFIRLLEAQKAILEED